MASEAEIDDLHSQSTSRETGTKERLVAAAGPIFARAGFEAATVREICEAAGANLAAINYHFGDKWGLYVATIEEAHQSLSDSVPFPEWPAGISAEQKLALFVRSIVGRMMDVHDTGWPSELLTREILNPSAACEPLIERNFRPHFRALLTIVQELVGRVVLDEELERLAFSVIAQCFHHRMANAFIKRLSVVPMSRHDDLEALIEHVTRFSISALIGWDSVRSDNLSNQPLKLAPRHDPAPQAAADWSVNSDP